MKSSILILILILLTKFSMFACSCNERKLDLPMAEFGLLSNESKISASFDDLIFQGELISYINVEIEEIRYLSTKYQRQSIELKFKVDHAFKGDYINKGDTILIYTNSSSDACGFYTSIHTKSIIFAASVGLGRYFTYRGDCCKSVSESQDKKRYDEYMRFIDVVTNKIDGKYVFKQPKSYWDGGYINENYELSQLQFEINNGEFNGLWKITFRNGLVIEEGQYLFGKRIGKWIFRRIELDISDNYEYGLTSEVEVKHKNGRPYRKTTRIIKNTFEHDDEKIRIERTKLKYKETDYNTL